MKIIFVGMHNKPHFSPLCGSTKTGKIIERIIIQLPAGTECLKTNLYDVDYYPKSWEEKYKLAKDWQYRINPDIEDLIILLGNEVHKNFQNTGNKLIKVAHPSSIRSSQDQINYVCGVLIGIRNYIENYKNPF